MSKTLAISPSASGMVLGTTLKSGWAEAGNRAAKTRKSEGRGWNRGIGSKLSGAWRQGDPLIAVEVNDSGGQWGQVGGIEEIGVEGPVAGGGIIDGACSGPGPFANLAVEHLHHGTIVVKVHTAPVLHQAEKIFHAAAIVAGDGSNVAGQNGGVDGVGRGGAAADGVAAVEGGPGRGQDIDG